MESKDMQFRSLIAQYHVFQLEKIIFTIFFILAMLAIPVAWIITHVYHDLQLGQMIATVALILGLAMATHAGNSIQTIKRVAGKLNGLMDDKHRSFEYDLGQETDALRFVVTLIAKIIGAVLVLWCYNPWPVL